jgi:hypothetical protein
MAEQSLRWLQRNTTTTTSTKHERDIVVVVDYDSTLEGVAGAVLYRMVVDTEFRRSSSCSVSGRHGRRAVVWADPISLRCKGLG